jgi:hypothetical protein
MIRAFHLALALALIASIIWWTELVEVIGPLAAYLAMGALVLIFGSEVKRALRPRLSPHQEQTNG